MAQDLIREFYKNLRRYIKQCRDKKYYKYKIKVTKDFLLYSKKKLGKKRIKDLTKEDVVKFLECKEKHLSKATVRNYKTILNSFCKRASLL